MTSLDIVQLLISFAAIIISLIALYVSNNVRKKDLEIRLNSLASELKSDALIHINRARHLRGKEVARQGASGTVVNSGSNQMIIDQLVASSTKLDSIKTRVELVLEAYRSDKIPTAEEAIWKLEELRGDIRIIVAFLDKEQGRLE